MDKELTFIIPDNLSHDICASMIARYERDVRKQNVPFKYTALRITSYPDWGDIDTLLYSKLNESLTSYFKHCETLVKSTMFYNTTMSIKDTGYNIQRYRRGETDDWHSDFKECEGNVTYLTYMWCLNTLEEDDGGCLSFAHGMKIRPETGKLIIFPSTWTNVYRSDEVLKRTSKYIMVGYLMCKRVPPPVEEKKQQA